MVSLSGKGRFVIRLFRQMDGDFTVIDVDAVDAAGNRVSAGVDAEIGDQVFAFELAEPGVGQGDAPNGEVIEDDCRVVFLIIEHKAGPGLERAAADDRKVRVQLCADTGVNGLLGKFEPDLVTQPGVVVEQGIELSLGENQRFFTRLIAALLNMFDFVIEGALFRGIENDRGDGAVTPPVENGARRDEDECHNADDDQGLAPTSGWADGWVCGGESGIAHALIGRDGGSTVSQNRTNCHRIIQDETGFVL